MPRLGPSTLLTGVAGIIACLVAGLAHAALEDLTLVSVSEADGRAVVKTQHGKMHVVKAGDRLPGSSAVVREVWGKRLVVEETVQGDPDRKQIVWITNDGKGEPGLRRLHRKHPKKPVAVPAHAAASVRADK